MPEYVIEDEGPDHMKTFTARVRVADRLHGRGVGRSKKEAEQQAAETAYRTLSAELPGAAARATARRDGRRLTSARRQNLASRARHLSGRRSSRQQEALLGQGGWIPEHPGEGDGGTGDRHDAGAGASAAQKLTFVTMTAMVVGSMVGAGVFSLPRRFAQETGVLGALIAWLIAGTGMLMLAFVFQTLAIRKPELDAGVYAYAKAGFGEYLGFFSAFGYWASACVGNVTYWVLIMSTVGAIAPALGDGDTLLAIALSTVGHLGVLLPDPARA